MKITTCLSTATSSTSLSALSSAKLLKAIGYDGIDYGLAWAQNKKSIFLPGVDERLAAEAESYRNFGLEISQAHLHYLSSEFYGPGLYKNFEDIYLSVIIREIELCAAMNCPIAVIHTYFEPDRQATIDSNRIFFEKLLPHLEKNNVKLALENVYGGGDAEYGRRNNALAEDFMVYFEEFKSPYLGACLDTGHASCVGVDATEMVKTYGKHLIALHANNNCGRDIHMIPGTMYPWADLTDWPKFFEALKEIDYQGTYNLELSSGTFNPDPMSGISFLQMAYNISNTYLNNAGLR